MPFDIQEYIKSPSSYVKKVSIDDVFDFLEVANEYYRNHSDTLISDDLYDWLEEYAKKKKPNNPFFKKVGAPTENKELLPEWMGSLDKIRDDPKALDLWKAKHKAPYILSEKLDGNSGMYGISKNKELHLFTRGDGTFGRNISKYIEYFQDDYKSTADIFNLKEINTKNAYPLLVRGELILSKASWELIKDKGANARNVIAGTLNAKTPDREIAKHIKFVAYELIEPKMPFYEGLMFMKQLGFETVYSKAIESVDITTDKLTEILIDRRKNSLYDIDGIVVRDNKIHKIIKEKNPKYAFAFKTMITHEVAEVIVLNVEWNVSKDGLIKPIVQFAPVTINNVKIKQTSGFNGAFIQKNGIGIGSKITIIRSGDVIPHITSVITKTTPMMPTIPYEWNDTRVDIMVKKEDDNEQMKLRQMEHFAKTMCIAHVGEGTLKKLFEKGIDTIPKLLSLQKSDLLLIDGIKEKSAENISESLKKTFENTNCLKLMVASNLFGRGFGERKLNLILSAHPEILDGALLASLNEIEGIGEATSKQFLENLPKFYMFLKEINYSCVKTKNTSKKKSKSTLSGMTIVFTGFRNKEWEKAIIERDGTMGTAISKNTSIVVAVDKTEESVKLKKARELGITLYNKEEFFEKHIKD